METVVVRLLNDPTNPQFKMKYIESIEYATPKTSRDGKRITGLDENAIDIINIEDSTLRAAKIKEIKTLREKLEKLLNKKLGPDSEFWDKFYVSLSDDDIKLDPSNALDKVREVFLIANKYTAPSREAIENDEEYIDCIYYMHREKEEIGKKVKKQQDRDKAVAQLYNLKENPNKLKLLASYIFGLDIKGDLGDDEAYGLLSDFVTEKDEKIQKKNLVRFFEAQGKTPEHMETKLIFDKAIKKRIIVARNKVYRRGDRVLGNSYEEALETLSSIEETGELHSIQKEVNAIE